MDKCTGASATRARNGQTKPTPRSNIKTKSGSEVSTKNDVLERPMSKKLKGQEEEKSKRRHKIEVSSSEEEDEDEIVYRKSDNDGEFVGSIEHEAEMQYQEESFIGDLDEDKYYAPLNLTDRMSPARKGREPLEISYVADLPPGKSPRESANNRPFEVRRSTPQPTGCSHLARKIVGQLPEKPPRETNSKAAPNSEKFMGYICKE
ncbi:hypothetical protein JTB14_026989 [Gonioctena quinquepunctata]|nr:hypothetical protein JTB14_026989 [Gonioctena quinquepunctata]